MWDRLGCSIIVGWGLLGYRAEFCFLGRVFLFILYRFVTENYVLPSLILPTSLMVISNQAFYTCSAFQTIIIPT